MAINDRVVDDSSGMQSIIVKIIRSDNIEKNTA